MFFSVDLKKTMRFCVRAFGMYNADGSVFWMVGMMVFSWQLGDGLLDDLFIGSWCYHVLSYLKGDYHSACEPTHPQQYSLLAPSF